MKDANGSHGLNGGHPLHFLPGKDVVLIVPDNPGLHGRDAKIESLTEWGAHVVTGVGSGKFRAFFSEMRLKGEKTHSSRDEGFTGDACDQCGSLRMRRNGSCLLCVDCGSTSGCS